MCCLHLGMLAFPFYFPFLTGRLHLLDSNRKKENRLNDTLQRANTCLRRRITLSHLSLVLPQKQDWIAYPDQVLTNLPPSLQQHQLPNKAKKQVLQDMRLCVHTTEKTFVFEEVKYPVASVRCDRVAEPSFTSCRNQTHSLHSIIKSFINY